MNPVSLSLDLLLVVLLIAALGFCWRLERRLKSLRDSHADFAGAVADLDRAAQRAETGLAQLRVSTDEAVELLASRIEKARDLAAKLERVTIEAVLPGPSAANDVARPADIARASLERLRARPATAAVAPADAVLAAEVLARRLASDDSLVLRNPMAAREQPSPRPQPASYAQPAPYAQSTPQRQARPRPSFDEDLFETPARAAGGGSGRR